MCEAGAALVLVLQTSSARWIRGFQEVRVVYTLLFAGFYVVGADVVDELG